MQRSGVFVSHVLGFTFVWSRAGVKGPERSSWGLGLCFKSLGVRLLLVSRE